MLYEVILLLLIVVRGKRRAIRVIAQLRAIMARLAPILCTSTHEYIILVLILLILNDVVGIYVSNRVKSPHFYLNLVPVC